MHNFVSGFSATTGLNHSGLWPQSSRKELVADIQELKRKVTGAMKEEGL
jgi:hypothetical protein